jgi:hypothetical protein
MRGNGSEPNGLSAGQRDIDDTFVRRTNFIAGRMLFRLRLLPGASGISPRAYVEPIQSHQKFRTLLLDVDRYVG